VLLQNLQELGIQVEVLDREGGLVAFLEVCIDQSEERLKDIDVLFC
jgi:hypothetical protein